MLCSPAKYRYRSMVQKKFSSLMLIHSCTLVIVPPHRKTGTQHPSTQTVQYGATDKTVSIDHLKQNAGTICTKHCIRLGQVKP